MTGHHDLGRLGNWHDGDMPSQGTPTDRAAAMLGQIAEGRAIDARVKLFALDIVAVEAQVGHGLSRPAAGLLAHCLGLADGVIDDADVIRSGRAGGRGKQQTNADQWLDSVVSWIDRGAVLAGVEPPSERACAAGLVEAARREIERGGALADALRHLTDWSRKVDLRSRVRRVRALPEWMDFVRRPLGRE